MTYSWTIKLFAGLSERFGTPAITISSPEQQLTVAQLKQLLMNHYPNQAELLRISFVAHNHAYASDDTIIHTSDELALLPPVSGGEARE